MVFCLKLDLFTTTTFGGQKFFHKSTLRNCSWTKEVTGKPVKCYDVCWCRKVSCDSWNFMFATIPDWSCTTTFAGSVPIKRISDTYSIDICIYIYTYQLDRSWQQIGRRVDCRWTKEDIQKEKKLSLKVMELLRWKGFTVNEPVVYGGVYRSRSSRWRPQNGGVFRIPIGLTKWKPLGWCTFRKQNPWSNHVASNQNGPNSLPKSPKTMTSEQQKNTYKKSIPFHYTGWFLGIPFECRMDHSNSI